MGSFLRFSTYSEGTGREPRPAPERSSCSDRRTWYGRIDADAETPRGGGLAATDGGLRPGRSEAQAAIVEDLDARHGQRLFGFVRRLGLSDEQADDAVQEVLLRLWSELDTGTFIENPKGWAYRAIYRLAMDQHRLRRRLAALTEALGRAGSLGDTRDSSDRLAVWAEVDLLPPRQRQVLYLRYRADLSFAEIGDALGITASAARSHATQAMATLRSRFGTSEGGS